MEIIVNGNLKSIEDSSTVSNLLSNYNLNEKHVIVQINEIVIPLEKYNSHIIKHMDKLEILSLVGGG
ncbi:MAG: sulfur carrier protein ThiS [Spirochaetales bacterium]|nr:sulfur carrier protein ThiS [Spirochaetales bacterium]